jgi:lysyl-tRNA synthetase class 2
MSDSCPYPDFRPSAGWDNLRLRADLLRRTREFFHRHGFLEVETPILSADTVVDRHLDPFCIELGRVRETHHDTPRSVRCTHPTSCSSPRRLWLQTSPEFCMKRLLAAGAGAIYQITRSFRQGEQGPLHNPEFTIVEWYRPGDGMDEGMQLLGELCEVLLGRGPAERLSYRRVFQEHVGLDPHTADPEALVSAVSVKGITPPKSLSAEDRDGWLDLLLAGCVGPRLGCERPAILYDYPVGQAALARIRDDDPPVAERFELFVSGIELANGYHELTDAAELRQRNAKNNALRRSDGNAPLPEQSRLLSAMDAGLPHSTGVALGFDRVVMLAAGAKNLGEVTAFPMDRA